MGVRVSVTTPNGGGVVCVVPQTNEPKSPGEMERRRKEFERKKQQAWDKAKREFDERKAREKEAKLQDFRDLVDEIPARDVINEAAEEAVKRALEDIDKRISIPTFP